MLWLKMNSFNLLTMLDCCGSGLLFHSIEEKSFISFHSSPLSWLAVQTAGEAFSWSVRRKISCNRLFSLFILLNSLSCGFDPKHDNSAVSWRAPLPSTALPRFPTPVLMLSVLSRQLQNILAHSLIKAGALQGTMYISKWMKNVSWTIDWFKLTSWKNL